MGKPYNFNFSFASPNGGSAGTMKCACCGKDIDSKKHDWLHYQKPSKHDWAYVCFHRSCYKSDDGWSELIAKNKKTKDEYELLLKAAKLFAEKNGIKDAYSFASLACEAFNTDIDELI